MVLLYTLEELSGDVFNLRGRAPKSQTNLAHELGHHLVGIFWASFL